MCYCSKTHCYFVIELHDIYVDVIEVAFMGVQVDHHSMKWEGIFKEQFYVCCAHSYHLHYIILLTDSSLSLFFLLMFGED